MLPVRTSIAALAALLALTMPAAFAQGFAQIDRLTHFDISGNYDRTNFGENIALAGNLALVSAPNRGGTAGAVYVVRLEADASLTYLDQLDPGGNTFQFGRGLDADGDWAAIYELYDNVLIYQRVGDGFVLRQRLDQLPSQGGITIRGVSAIALRGDTLVIGDHSAHVPGPSGGGAGAAAVYRRSGATWSLEALLPSPNPGSTFYFGDAVAVSGDMLVIGAQSADASDGGATGTSFGRAWVYRRSGSNWNLEAVLDAPADDRASGANFGRSVAIDGDTAVVGCRVCNNQTGAPSNSGSFHVFNRNAGGANNWGWVQEVSASNASYIDNFSVALRLRGDLLMASAPGASTKAAYLYTRSSGGTFQEVTELTSTESSGSQAQFGYSMDFDGVRSIVGAYLFPDEGPQPNRYGAIFSFTNPTFLACVNGVDTIFCNGFESWH